MIRGFIIAAGISLWGYLNRYLTAPGAVAAFVVGNRAKFSATAIKSLIGIDCKAYPVDKSTRSLRVSSKYKTIFVDLSATSHDVDRWIEAHYSDTRETIWVRGGLTAANVAAAVAKREDARDSRAASAVAATGSP